MAYPLSVRVEPQPIERDRMSAAFRLFLAIPHLFAVGGIGLGVAVNSSRRDLVSFGGETGLLGSIAFLLAVFSWFTIVLFSEHYNAIRRYTHFYLRWRVRALAYLMLLADRYPPFGDGPYPIALTFERPDTPRDRLTVGLRLLLVIPHAIVLFFVVCAWWVTTIVAWFLILITGRYPQGLYNFGAGALRWLIRVEAYILLLVDDYPPFSLT
ncbi:MAG: hypothetical protein JWL71_4206 [Acidobacteria bacterium]|nr:hypothetical protein [Acidobacteriota bacterium]